MQIGDIVWGIRSFIGDPSESSYLVEETDLVGSIVYQILIQLFLLLRFDFGMLKC